MLKRRRKNPEIRMGWVSKWRMYNYDTWGNEKDGWEVNDVFKTDNVVEIPNILVDSYTELIKWLKKQGIIKKSARARSIEVYGDYRRLSFSYKGKPEFELRYEGEVENIQI